MADLRTRLDEPPDSRLADEVPGPQPVEESTPTDPDAPAASGDQQAPAVAAPPSRVNPIARTYTPPAYWGLLVAALAALLVLLAAVDVVLYVQGTDGGAGQREEALTAARRVALDLSTLGAGNAEDNLARLADSTTGSFRDDLIGYSTPLRETLVAGGVSSDARVRTAGLERIDDESAVALVAVSATVTSKAMLEGTPRQYRLAVDLRRVDGRWRASSVSYVP